MKCPKENIEVEYPQIPGFKFYYKCDFFYLKSFPLRISLQISKYWLTG